MKPIYYILIAAAAGALITWYFMSASNQAPVIGTVSQAPAPGGKYAGVYRPCLHWDNIGNCNKWAS